jgi:Leucine-rich repeat (LRR) protein
MNELEVVRICDNCKIIKPINLFYKYKYCKKCHIIDYINIHLSNARIANHLNLSIDEFNNIIKINTNHIQNYNINSSSIINNNIINDYLNEKMI